MTRIILLDETPLSLIVHPSDKGRVRQCKEWYEGLIEAGACVRVPEIADYELRRNLIVEGFAASLALLNRLVRSTGGLVTINSRVMKKAAEYWAQRCHKNPGQTHQNSLKTRGCPLLA